MTADDAGARVAEILERIADGLGIDAEVRVEDDADGVSAEFVGDDLALLIAFPGGEPRKQVSVDAAGYRERRAATLRAAADQAAEAAVRDRKPVALDPMSALERKVVHEHLKTRYDVETYSEGQEPSRRLVVAPLLG
jgi:spoIIIJ-associated protein